MRFPLLTLICIVVPAFCAWASEPTTVVVSRWDWAAVKFDEQAQKDLERGDLKAAHQNVDEALRRGTDYWPSYYTRARIFAAEAKWEPALRDCNEALRRYSAWVPAAVLRAQINAHIGNYSAAKKEFDHVIEIQPRREFYAMAFDGRAWFRATCPNASFRNPPGAIDDAKKACTITQWKEASPLDTLATAYAASGDFDSAVRYGEQAMKAYDAGSMNKTLQQHLAIFKQRRSVSAH